MRVTRRLDYISFFVFYHFLVHSWKRFGPFYAALIGTSCRFCLIEKWFRSLRSLLRSGVAWLLPSVLARFARFFLANGDHCASTESSRTVLSFLLPQKEGPEWGLQGLAGERTCLLDVLRRVRLLFAVQSSVWGRFFARRLAFGR